MRLVALLALLPLPAFAVGNPESIYTTLITGEWAATPAACADESGWTVLFYEGGLTIGNEGGEICGFDRPFTDSGVDVVLDAFCVQPGEKIQSSARRIWLDLESVSPGLRDPGDSLSMTDNGTTSQLQRCP
jgi:hypothetical protein